MKKPISALLIATMLITPAFAAEDDFWSNLEDSYYQNVPVPYSDLENSDFLESEESLDWSKAVERYSSHYDLSSAAGVEEFLSDLENGGKIADTLTSDQRLMVFVQNSSGEEGTAIINPDTNAIVGLHHEDGGEMFLMNMNNGVKQSLLNSGIDLEQTTAKQFLLEGLAHCILYTDGKVELLQPLSGYPDYMSDEKAYTTDELIDLVKSHEAELTQYEGINANLDPEKPDVTVGTVNPLKPNVETGR